MFALGRVYMYYWNVVQSTNLVVCKAYGRILKLVMDTATERVLAVVMLLIVQFVYCSAQGGCSPPAGILMTGDDKLTNDVPTILNTGQSSLCEFEHTVLYTIT